MKHFFLFVNLTLFSFLNAQEVVRGPYLQSASSSSIIIKWRTSYHTDSKVWIGTQSDQLNNSFYDAGPNKDHEIFIDGLLPNTKYFYAIGNQNGYLSGGNEKQYFFTAPITGTTQSVKAWVLGDCGTGNDDARKVRDAYYQYMDEEETDLVLLLGDNAYHDGEDWEYQKAVFENMYEDVLLHVPLWSCIGNHEYLSANFNNESGAYFDIFSFPKNGEVGGIASGSEAYYSFDHANIHFVILDSQGAGNDPGDPMIVWLENDLNATNQDWIIVLFHHPPYSRGSHNSDDESNLIEMRENVLPILEAGGVDLVLSGHSHSYERSYLMNGHYGYSYSLQSNMILDNGDGRIDGDGFYQKEQQGNNAGKGAVYIVAGSSGKVSEASLNHPVMYYNAAELGSLSLEIEGDKLDLKFINDESEVKDYFTIIKTGLATGLAPQVAITNLEMNQSFSKNELVMIQATAQDQDGEITKVELYIDNVYQETKYEAPYDFEWISNETDTYAIQLKANDDDGNIAFSNTINIVVQETNTDFCLEDITIDCSNSDLTIVEWELPELEIECSNNMIDCTHEQIEGATLLGTMNDSRYFLFTEKLLWQEAKTKCEQYGGHLLVINDQAENEFIQEQMSESFVWIGYTDEAIEGQFQWVNGQAGDFENWGEWQPSNTNDKEHYVHFSKANGRWYDKSNYEHAFIMELNCTTTDVNEQTSMLSFNQIAGIENGGLFPIGTTYIEYELINSCNELETCGFEINVLPCFADCENEAIDEFEFLYSNQYAQYYVSKEKMNWLDAQTICNNEGGHLVNIQSATENEALLEALEHNGMDDFVLIGLNDKDEENNLVWNDGITVNYSNFADEFRNDDANDYGLFNPWRGSWSMVNELVEKRFILEIPCNQAIAYEHILSEKFDRSSQNKNNHMFDELKLFPNPVINQLSIQLHVAMEYDNVQLNILRLDGTNIFSEQSTIDQGINNWKILLDRLESGVYSLQIVAETKMWQAKFVKL